MRLIIAGSRSIPVGVSMLIIDAACRVHVWDPREVIVIAEADGPATAAELWAKAKGIPVRAIWERWAQLGDKAGAEAHDQMVRLGTHLLALWDGESTGTPDLIRRARVRGLRLVSLEVVASPATKAGHLEAQRAKRRAQAAASRERRKLAA